MTQVEGHTVVTETSYGSPSGYDSDSQFLQLYYDYETVRTCIAQLQKTDQNSPRDPLECLKRQKRVVDVARSGLCVCPGSVFFLHVFPQEVLSMAAMLLTDIKSATWPKTLESEQKRQEVLELLEEVVRVLERTTRTQNQILEDAYRTATLYVSSSSKNRDY